MKTPQPWPPSHEPIQTFSLRNSPFGPTSPRPIQTCLLCSPFVYWQAGSWPSIERPSCGLCKYITTALNHPTKFQLNLNCFNSLMVAFLDSTILDSTNMSQPHWYPQTLTQTQFYLPHSKPTALKNNLMPLHHWQKLFNTGMWKRLTITEKFCS